MPRSKVAWATFTAARVGAANLWNAMVVRHARIRRLGWAHPTYNRWEKWARGRFPGISAQTTQQIVLDFCNMQHGAARARVKERESGSAPTTKNPWRTPKYRDVPYTNQAAKMRGGYLLLPNGKGRGILRIKLPADRPLPGRLMEVGLCFGRVRLVCKMDDAVAEQAPAVGVDLGVNTMIAATDGVTAVVVNGRSTKAIQQYRNKIMASSWSAQSRHKRGSRRHKKLQRRLRKSLNKCNHKLRDIAHKATRAVADAFPGSRVVVGKAFQARASQIRAVQAQQVAQAWTSKITYQLDYKLSGARKVDESYSSQTCPACGCLQKCKRVYRCKACGLTAPRDVVGAVNIRAIGLYGKLTPEQPMPTVVRFVRPLRKYPRPPQGALGSSGGTPASSSIAA